MFEEMLHSGEQNVDIDGKELREIHRDVLGFCRHGGLATVSLLLVRSGRLVDSANFHFAELENKTDQEVLENFLAQYYLTQGEVAEDPTDNSAIQIPGTENKVVPGELLLPFPISDQNLFEESMNCLGLRLKILVPERGQKHDQILLANKNADHAFEERQREQGNVYRVLADLKARLRLENYPRRMECFDISNLGDTGIVASRVVFIDGKADKSHYRHYHIRSTDGQNDFGAMKEVLTRRLSKLSSLQDPEATATAQEEMPDLLIIDGGKGQLSMATEVMRELNITGIDLVSLAKAKVRANFEGAEVERTLERIFKPGRLNPINLAPESPVCHLMERIRDEAHRFAIEFQRKQRKME
jgi:excinuclease ABC subunit C